MIRPIDEHQDQTPNSCCLMLSSKKNLDNFLNLALLHIFFLISETNRGGFGLDMNCGRLLAIPSLFRASCVVFLALAFTTSFGSSYRYIYYPSKYISFIIELGQNSLLMLVMVCPLPPTILNFRPVQLDWPSQPQNSKLLVAMNYKLHIPFQSESNV